MHGNWKAGKNKEKTKTLANISRKKKLGQPIKEGYMPFLHQKYQRKTKKRTKMEWDMQVQKYQDG